MAAPPPPTPRLRTATERAGPLLELRGQGRNAFSQLLFGRLQMFTGVEYFGFLFFLFWAAVLFQWRRSPEKSALDKVLLSAALVVIVIVLSGARKLSWSNPRYVGSVLIIAAYFAAPLLVSLEERLRRFSPRSSRLAAWTVVGFLIFPAVLVTAIRGAKVEISNPGTFYSDFRSLEWVDYTVKHPGQALGAFWDKYFGIKKTVRYFLADEETQLRHAHDYFAATLYVNQHLPEDARLLVFRDARFFYYGKRYAVVWYSPENDSYAYRKAHNAEEMLRYLVGSGFTHVLVDDYSTRYFGYINTSIGELLDDPRFAELIYEYGIARVYRLRAESLEP